MPRQQEKSQLTPQQQRDWQLGLRAVSPSYLHWVWEKEEKYGVGVGGTGAWLHSSVLVT